MLKYKKGDLMIKNSLFTSTAGRYARALFHVGKRKECLHEIKTAYDGFVKIDKKYMALLNTMSKENVETFCNAISQLFGSEFINFIKLLILNKRMCLLKKIYTLFNVLLNYLNNERNIVVYTQFDITKQYKNTITNTLNRVFKNTVNVFEFKTDCNLLTGMAIQCEGTIYDVSGRNFLQQLESSI